MDEQPSTQTPPADGTAVFAGLTPDAVINAVEHTLDVRCSNRCRPLTSYINRVYEVGLEDGTAVVAKFYRPGRWSRESLQDELDFLIELHAAEVPVVPPLPGRDGQLLAAAGGIWFSVFPKKGGRPLDEPSLQDWPQLGRLIARLHAVGAQHPPRARIRLHPAHSSREHLHYILDSGLVAPAYRRAYEDTARALLDDITPRFDDAGGELRIHADCHRCNILHRPGEGYHLIDFDDMAVGPAVQDLWLLLPDRPARCPREVELLIEGYETFREFPYPTLRLVEPLRAMRFLHFTAWCARQKSDGGFTRLAPDWGTPGFWRQEVDELVKQHQEIRDALNAAPPW